MTGHSPSHDGARLPIQRCQSCGAHTTKDRERCPRCLSTELEPTWACGAGHLSSFAIVHRAPDPRHQERTPYNVAIVRLVEGPRLLTGIVGTPAEDLEIGMPVRVTFPIPGELPYFEHAPSPKER